MKKIITGILAVLVSVGWTNFAGAYSITDTVIVDGKEWAQVDLFTGLTWNDINAVCPGGVCGAGTLNGYDMLGWTWASTNMVNALFNYYIATTPRQVLPIGSVITGDTHLGPGPDEYTEFLNPVFPLDPDPNMGSFATAFFADGWRPTQHFLDFSDETVGLMSDTTTDVGVMARGAGGGAYTNFDSSQSLIITYGGWFQRNAVPTPATLPSIIIALVGLAWARRRA